MDAGHPTWTVTLADALLESWQRAITHEALEAARRVVLDTVICALAGRDHEASRIVRAVVDELGGAPRCSLVGEGERTSPLNAILVNGTSIRALDCNDFEIVDGQIMGHPSDNVAVALAFGELTGASGADFLQSIVLGYELYGRLIRHLFQAARKHWDHVSVSGLVAAAIAGLLLRLDRPRLADALAVGGAQPYSLGALRQGEISMLKAAANARTATSGGLAALLAARGLSGPPRLLEGRGGLLSALELEPSADLLAALCRPPERWHIADVSFKPYPSLATSQGVIAATRALVRQHQVTPKQVQGITVRLPDSRTTREHLADPARSNPTTRETADHSIPFLVAVAIEDGDVGVRQYEDERWHRASTRSLMERVTLVADATLNPHAATQYPAVVSVVTDTGRTLTCEMPRVPGGPEHPLSDDELVEKLHRITTSPPSPAFVASLRQQVDELETTPDVSDLMALLRTPVG